jgi:outer membrane protein TolC
MACTVGPDFLRPDAPKAMSFLPDAPTEFVAGDIPGGEAQSLVQSMDIPGQWWSVFQSPQLNGLIEIALRANPDIKAAVAGLKQARENARAQRATMFPA